MAFIKSCHAFLVFSAAYSVWHMSRKETARMSGEGGGAFGGVERASAKKAQINLFL